MSYTLTTDKTWSETMAEVRTTFQRWAYDTPGGRRIEWDVQCAVPPVKSRNSTLGPADRAVILSFYHPGTGQLIELTMNEQSRPVDNLRVLYLGVEAMRLNEKRGIGKVMQDAYLQLSAPPKERDPWEVLGVRSDARAEVVKAAYRARANVLHPDKGGDAEEFKELEAAWTKVRPS